MSTKVNEKADVLNNDSAIIIEGVDFDYKKVYEDEFYENFVNSFKKNPSKRYFYKFVKRCFDFFVSFFAIIVLLPLFIILGIAIKIDSKGPILFKQVRVGKNKKSFNIYKFRSMRIDAPHDEMTSQFANPEDYYTKVGKFLRKLSLDELPQLFNVLCNKMSIIGYRPLIEKEEKCNNLREKLGVFEFKPGISGYAQVHGRDDVYYKNKAIMDAEYVKKASICFDVKLMFQTVAVVFTKKGNRS
ncbi:MAG: sugar transferase [Clostridia bacterium]|nr:sugar transferase [Clostridia bacterium]